MLFGKVGSDRKDLHQIGK